MVRETSSIVSIVPHGFTCAKEMLPWNPANPGWKSPTGGLSLSTLLSWRPVKQLASFLIRERPGSPRYNQITTVESLEVLCFRTFSMCSASAFGMPRRFIGRELQVDGGSSSSVSRLIQSFTFSGHVHLQTLPIWMRRPAHRYGSGASNGSKCEP